MDTTISLEQLAAERKYLYAYAMTRVRDPDLAEDVVQETLVAALEGLSTFQCRSSLRTWLVAILRHRLADALKARSRLVPAGAEDEEVTHGDLESFFDRPGRWDVDTRPKCWEQPESAMEQQQFLNAIELCVRHLPTRTAEVFTLRYVVGESIKDICENLEITPSNCWVMLYRARMRLRGCLGSWIADAGGTLAHAQAVDGPPGERDRRPGVSQPFNDPVRGA